MVFTYLFCLIGGSVLIAISISGDGEGNSHDLDLGGSDPDIPAGGPAAVLLSSSFWSFSMAGFGLSGLLLSVLQPSLTTLLVLPITLFIGLTLGWGAARSLRFLATRQVDSLVRSEELIGLEARVTLSLSSTQRGFVEVIARGSLLRRPAISASGTLESGERVVVLQSEGNTLIVDRLDG